MNRREFVKSLSFLGATIAISPLALSKNLIAQTTVGENAVICNTAKTKFNKIMELARSKSWHLLPIGDIVARVGLEFVHVPYGAGTLDANPEEEKLTVNFSELDCVTFFENSLGIARCIKLQRYEFDDLLAQIKFTRYRDGILTDYSSRLHYTSDWILNNIQKGTIKDVTKEIGGIEHRFNLSFMTKNPTKYKALSQKNSDSDLLIQKIRETEIEISQKTFHIIPSHQISRASRNISDGDIIAIAINTDGLDYGHLGISLNRRLMHASRRAKKVIIDGSISKYVNSNKNNIGITVLRPQETS